MNVCMIAYTFYEGDNRVRRYAESLVRHGHQVDVIALRQAAMPARDCLRGVTLYKIQRRSLNERRKIDYALRLISFLIKSAWAVTFLNMKKRYALVHVHSTPDFEVFAALVPRLTGAHIILDIHDIVPELYAGKFGAKRDSLLFKAFLLAERVSIAFANRVIVANDIWHERLVSRSAPADKCLTIMNYPDPTIFHPKSVTRNDNRFLLMYPGTLSRHQGLETAIRATGALKKTIPEIAFDIYGSGTDEPFFKQLTRELDLEGVVSFKGVVGIEEVARFMTTADLAVEPKSNKSFGDEAFSTKILEFMMVGVPVVVSETTVHRHYLNDRVVRFFTSDSVPALIEAVTDLFRHPHHRKLLAQEARKFVVGWTWSAREPLYLDLVESLTTSRHRKNGHAAASRNNGSVQ